jgi:hypothetical protein
MSSLEKDYPKVKFVYMTGHLDGSQGRQPQQAQRADPRVLREKRKTR